MSNWGRGRGGYSNDNHGRGRGRDDRDDRGEQRFPNNGALLPSKNRRSENSPDYYGDFVISDDVLDYVVREAERGRDVKLELSGWSRMSRNNMNFTSLKVNIPYEVRQQEGGNPTYRGRYDRGGNRGGGRSERPGRNSYREQSGRGQDEPDERDMFRGEGSYERDDRRRDERRTRDDDRDNRRDEPPPHRQQPEDRPGFFDDEIPF